MKQSDSHSAGTRVYRVFLCGYDSKYFGYCFPDCNVALAFYKGNSGGERGKSGFLSRMDKALMDHNIDVSVCTQRAVCWIVRSAAAKVTTGEGGSLDKIIDGIAR